MYTPDDLHHTLLVATSVSTTALRPILGRAKRLLRKHLSMGPAPAWLPPALCKRLPWLCRTT